MVTVSIIRKCGSIVRFYGKGHAKYAEHGNDIVCAAISALTQNAVIGITEVLDIKADFSYRSGFLDLSLENLNLNKEKRKDADIILETLLITLEGIEKQYPKYFKLLKKEEKPNV